MMPDNPNNMEYYGKVMTYDLEGDMKTFETYGDTMIETDNDLIRQILKYCDATGHDCHEMVTNGRFERWYWFDGQWISQND